MIENMTGIISREQFTSVLPGEERRKKGAYAITECFQEIPCNPCTTSCPSHAISQQDINALPEVDCDVCMGCGKCVAVCPGHACFVIDETAEPGKVLITLPYELMPVPVKGMEADALGRDGGVVGKAVVRNVRGGKNMDHTYLITVSVDESLLYDVRSVKLGGSENAKAGD